MASEETDAGDNPQAFDSKSLGKRAAKGGAYTAVAQIIAQLLRLFSNMLLTRLLYPEAYALMGYVTLVQIGLTMVTDVGIEQSIIQHKDGHKDYFRKTAWTMQVLRGALLWILAIAVCTPVAVAFYEKDQLIQLIPIGAVTVFISGFNSAKLGLARRNLHLGQIAIMEVSAQALAVIVMAIVAYIYETVWALIIGSIVIHGVKLIASMFFPGPRDGFGWNKEAAKDIYSYGKWIFLSTLVTFLGMNFDRIALGKLLDLNTFGVYNVAINLGLAPITVGFQVTQSVLLPALSEAARTNDPKVMRRTFDRSKEVVLPLGMFMMLGLVFLGPAFFYYLYDYRYVDAGWMLQLIIPATWFNFLVGAWTRAFMALGDTRSMAISSVLRFICSAIFGMAGYYVGELTGFLLGLGVGAVVAHSYVLWTLSQHGLSALKDDALYTFFGLLLALIGAYLPKEMARMGHLDEYLASVVLSVIILGPLGLLLAKVGIKKIKELKSGPIRGGESAVVGAGASGDSSLRRAMRRNRTAVGKVTKKSSRKGKKK